MSLLGSAGFDLYQSDPDNLTSQLSRLTSPILSPLTHAEDDDSSIHLLDLSAQNTITPEAGAVLTRSRSSTDASVKSAVSSPAYARKIADLTLHESVVSDDKESKPALTRSQSHSPSGSDVRVLDPDLTCIGLSDDSVDMWGLKIVKLVAFPDLVLPTQAGPSTPITRKPSLNASDLASVTSLGVNVAHAASVSCFAEGGASLYQSEGENDPTTRLGESLTKEDCRASSESPIFDVDEGKPWDEARYDDVEELSEDDDSNPNSPEMDPKLQRHPLLHVDSDRTTMPCFRCEQRVMRRASRTIRPSPEAPLIPFFSFTRTLEGSSLTAPVAILASLFTAGERHMVICSGELDVLDSRAGSPCADIAPDDLEDADDTFALPETEGTLRCLQIDLRKFGLGKHVRLPMLITASNYAGNRR